MTDSYSWPSPRGPYSGNLAFDVNLPPPLAPVWEHVITGKFRDGWRVGGRGKVLVPVRGTGMRCLRLEDGEVLWEVEKARRREVECFLAGSYVWSRIAAAEVGARSLQDGSLTNSWRVVLGPNGVCAKGGSHTFHLAGYTVDLESLSLQPNTIWRFGHVLGDRIYSRAERREGEIEESIGVTCYDTLTNQRLWTVPPTAEHPQGEDVIAASKEILVTFGFMHFYVRSTADGSLLWESDTAHPWQSRPWFAITSSRLIHYEQQDVLARDAATGELLWKTRVENLCTNLLTTEGLVWVGNQGSDGKHYLLALDQGTGEVVWKLKLKGKYNGFPLALIDDALVVHLGKKMVCFRAG